MKTRRSDQHFYKCTRSLRYAVTALSSRWSVNSLKAAAAALGASCVLIATPTAQAATDIDNLKLYAHSRIINYKQFQCFNALITKESSWRIDARNGSHYGLGQMKNTKYRDLDGYRQIDWSLRYITKRYGSMCNAYRFFIKKGYH